MSQTTSWEQISWLLDTIGPELTAASLGIEDHSVIRQWRDRQESPTDRVIVGRLEILYHLSRSIFNAFGHSSAIKNFLNNPNPHLMDIAPKIAIADSDPDHSAIVQTLTMAVILFNAG